MYDILAPAFLTGGVRIQKYELPPPFAALGHPLVNEGVKCTTGHFLLLTEGHTVGALVLLGIAFVGAHQDPLQGAVVAGVGVVGTLGNGALDTLVDVVHVGSSFPDFKASMSRFPDRYTRIFCRRISLAFLIIPCYNSFIRCGYSSSVECQLPKPECYLIENPCIPTTFLVFRTEFQKMSRYL